MNLSRVFWALVVFAFVVYPVHLLAQVELDRWTVVDSVLIGPSLEQATLDEIECPASMRCIVGGRGSNNYAFLRTTSDGGATWRTVWIDSTGIRDGRLEFARMIHGLSSRPSGFVVAALDSGIILRSTDFGVTWSEYQLPNRRQVRAVSTFESSSALALQDSLIWLTSDAGMTWESVGRHHPQIDAGYSVDGIAALGGRSSVLHLGRHAGALLASTLDAGDTWRDVGPIADNSIAAIKIDGSRVGCRQQPPVRSRSHPEVS